MAVNLLNGVCMWLCDCVAVGPAVVGHYDISDTHSEQEQQSHSHSGSFPPLLNLQDASTHRLRLNSHTNIRLPSSQYFQKSFFCVHQYTFFRLNHDPLHYQKIVNSLGGEKTGSNYSSFDFRNWSTQTN